MYFDVKVELKDLFDFKKALFVKVKKNNERSSVTNHCSHHRRGHPPSCYLLHTVQQELVKN